MRARSRAAFRLAVASATVACLAATAAAAAPARVGGSAWAAAARSAATAPALSANTPALPARPPAAGLPLDAFLPAAAPAADATVELVTAGGRHPFTVEIADTIEARSRGLMFRDSMAPDHGMLFDFGFDQDVAFWMKNTILSLDMVFVRGDGTVVSIAPATTPFSLEPVPSGAPVRFVLEVVAGTAARIGLKPGDKLAHPRVRPQ